MSMTSKNDGKKWIQTSIAVLCMIIVYVLISFFDQMNEWFELESKLTSFVFIAQGLSVAIGLAVFVYITTNSKTATFLSEVYEEVTKVVWPDKNETVKHTVGIMISVTIIGVLLSLFDLAASYMITLI